MCHDGTMSNAAGPIPPLHPNSRQDLQAHEEDQMLLCETKELASSLSAGRHRKLNFRAMILWFMGHRYNVALINELHCADSKAMTVILESTRQQGRRGFGPFYCTAASNTVPNIESAALNDLEGIVEPSE
jgi:hypothetical protein